MHAWAGVPNEDRGLPKIGYYLPGTTKWRQWWLDTENDAAIPQREMAAAYVYDLHYLWHDATGYALQAVRALDRPGSRKLRLAVQRGTTRSRERLQKLTMSLGSRLISGPSHFAASSSSSAMRASVGRYLASTPRQRRAR